MDNHTMTSNDGMNAAGGNKKKKKRKKKRKAATLAPPPIKSRKVARVVTSKFHEITHELERLENSPTKLKHVEKLRVQELKQELDNLGGRQRYQDASKISTRHNRTVKYVCSVLTSLQLRPRKKEKKLKVLEIVSSFSAPQTLFDHSSNTRFFIFYKLKGAINTHLLDVTFMDTTAIDLNSCNHRIQQIDFLDLKPSSAYDVVVSSMVINCVPTKEQRLKMLMNIFKHLKVNGHLFIILPLLCIRKSAFQNCNKFVLLLNDIGFKLKHSKTSPKLAFFCFEKKIVEVDVNNNTNTSHSRIGIPPKKSNNENALLKKWGKHLKFQFAV
jgi:25S rRNA (adenine2142-N1)-methyltransferase